MTEPMNKIEKLIFELCPKGVEFKKLGEVCEIADNKRKPVKSSLREAGEIPYYGANNIQDYVEGFTHEGNYVLIAEDGSASLENYSIQFASGKFWANNHVHVVRGNFDLCSKFLFHYLGNMNFIPYLTGGTRAKLTKGKMLGIKIPIPPIAVQQEIVNILDTFTTLEAELEAELEARKKQYDYYRASLFQFEEGNVEWKTLGDIYDFQYGEGNTIPTSGGEYPVYGSNGIVGSHDKYNSENAPVIGHIGAYAGIVNWAQGKHFVTYNGVICRIKNEVDPKFGYYFLQLQDFRSMANSGSQPFVSYDMLRKVRISLPDIATQRRIVAILDKFDALVNDISIGLPAELNARRKQYEYYRDKLLSFKPLEQAHAK